nr:epoxide hydrolase 4-like [Cherax quadricarinatus]
MGTIGQFLISALIRLISLAISVVVLVGLLRRRWKVGKQFFYVKPRPTPPPILTDPQWGTHAYVDLKEQGIKLHYVEAGDRKNPLIVFVHGFPEFWFSWRHQLKHFSQKYWVVAVDMRGYGESDKPSSKSQYNTDLLIQDLRYFVLALGKKCTLVAHDWGAVLAWQLVTLHPELFTAHISLNGPHPGAYQKYIRKSFTQLRMSWYICFFQTPWIPELMLRSHDLQSLEKMFRGTKKNVLAFPDDVIEAFKYYYSQKGAFTPPINYYRNIVIGDSRKLPVSKIRVPTLVIWGTDDLALSKPLAKLSSQECESGELKFVEGASHWVQQDSPDIVNTLIQQYLDSNPSSKIE